ncbi:uncharacterized protein [Montipora capricornis]|uniref:uncharacterized protein n=1 Tax=Montipora capricornis TaxID=246305 RepID=UPI0035F10040
MLRDLCDIRTPGRGTKAYDKLNNLLTNVRLVNDIKKLAADAQTSCLEGFHSTLNHWHPKMVSSSWLGTFCRHILASLHFNENVKRQKLTSEDGQEYYKVTYPKFKLGKEFVREVDVPPTYDYVQQVKKDLFSVKSRSELKKVSEKYNAKVPTSLTSQFQNRVNKSDAVQKKKYLHLCQQQEVLQSSTQTAIEAPTTKQRKAKCRKCGNPMKGHKASLCKQAPSL